jgi:hypothetical protein
VIYTALNACCLPEYRLMNRRVWACIGLIVWSELLVGRARAQTDVASTPTALVPGVSMVAKNAPNATPYVSQIQQFVQSQVLDLTGSDPIARKAAREKLIAECTPGSTPSYLDNYAQVIDGVATQILKRSPILPVRLNVAVVVQEIAKNSKSKALENSVLSLINDASEPIALRGMQAAKSIISIVVTNPATAANDPLIGAMLKAVKSHSKSGFIAADAYRALIPDPGLSVGQLASIDPVVLGPILDILNYRISLYTTMIPDNPAAETEVPTFLYRSYKNVLPALQHRIVQTLVDYISVVGQQAPAASKADLEEIIPTLQYSASAISKNNPDSGVILNVVAQFNKGMSGADIAQKTKPIFGQLQPQFPFLKAPPAVTPATAPTTKEAQ